ncbi:MAG: DNA polymerase II large subunit [Nitrososphaerota archaeon]
MYKVPPEFAEYYAWILDRVKEEYRIASEARKNLGTVVDEVETIIAEDMAERVELLVGPQGIAEKIRFLKDKLSRERLAFKLAEDIIYASIGKLKEEAAIKQALCTALAVMTPPCITAAPSEGIADVKIKKNIDGSSYLAVYFAGPIRAAGGTELTATVILADYIRRLLNLDRYKPTEEEIRRFKEELRTYVRMVSRFQYNVPDHLIEKALRNIPIEVTGIPTDNILAPSYRNLPRVETNYLRGGALRVMNDGIVGRARKALKLVEMLGLSGWEWLHEVAEEFSKVHSASSAEESYLNEVIGGRPVFSLPDTFGGFRLRYGRSYNTGMAAVGVHPMTMKVLDGYIATGTQLKLDYPGKGGVAMPVDTIEPPRVLLDDGSVVKVDNDLTYAEVKNKIVKILFLGDLLVSFGDCVENNVELRVVGYCEEWWALELKKEITMAGGAEKVAKILDITYQRLKLLMESPLIVKPTDREALRLSFKLKIPLHPSYCWFWENINVDELVALKDWLEKSRAYCKPYNGKVRLPSTETVRNILVKIVLEYRVDGEYIIIDTSTYRVLLALLAQPKNIPSSVNDSLEAISIISGITLRRKGGTFLGARMGRPEKAGMRIMEPPVHILFPVGLKGGASRDIANIIKSGDKVFVEVARLECQKCGSIGWKIICENCGTKRKPLGICTKCSLKYYNIEIKNCERCGGKISYTEKFSVDVKTEIVQECERLSLEMPAKIKGVRALTSRIKMPENIAKGLLRAQYKLSIYKDGTIRFDVTNAPLTHFMPRQISTDISVLRSLGYTYDIKGKPLTSIDQICELKPQDLIIPRKAAEHLLKVSRFIDDLLEKLAGIRPYYMCNKLEDLIGRLVASLSPHTYVAVIGRIIGFTDADVCFAHPLFHASKRRDCDGDEDSLMLPLDVFINFSRLYLPDRIGGKMDSPLLITPIVYPEEVDEQAHNLDIAYAYPLELYESARRGETSIKLSNLIATIKLKLGSAEQYGTFGFTHETRQLVINVSSAYKQSKTMFEKVIDQIKLTEKLSSVKIEKVVESIVSSHILPDVAGNTKAFFVQSFRCKKCNARFRRLPLNGQCNKCGSNLIQTVFRGTIEKYVELLGSTLSKHISTPYLKERASIVIENVRSTFVQQDKASLTVKQASLESFIES